MLQENDEYQESRSSLVFPDLPVQEIPEVINQYNIVCKDEEKFVKKLENGQLYTIYKINS